MINMKTLEKIYNHHCQTYSDIQEHLPTIKKYTEECDHIIEMGVRYVVSTYAFMMGKPKRMISYDILPVENFDIDRNDLKKLALDNDIDFDFIVADTTKIEIEETDLLFIDTWHVYQQLIVELTKHGNKSRKYIIMHDTTKFGEMGECGEGDGLMRAINEFLNDNNHWYVHEKFENNNGLTILKRKNETN
jgi:hypothetical protein